MLFLLQPGNETKPACLVLYYNMFELPLTIKKPCSWNEIINKSPRDLIWKSALLNLALQLYKLWVNQNSKNISTYLVSKFSFSYSFATPSSRDA